MSTKEKGSKAPASTPPLVLMKLPKLGEARAPAQPPEGGPDASRLAALDLPPLGAGFSGSQEEELGEDDEQDEQKITVMIGNILAKRQEETKAKQAKLVEETMAHIKTQVDTIQTAVTKDANDAVTKARLSFAKLEDGMEETMQKVNKLAEKYKEDLHAIWSEYCKQHENLARVKQDTLAAAEKRKQLAKKRIASLQADTDKAIADMEQRLDKMKAKRIKLPNTMDMFKTLLGGDF